MKVVMTDSEKNMLYVYGEEGVSAYDVADTGAISREIGSETVYYVTGAVEANMDDIRAAIGGAAGAAPVPEDSGVRSLFFKSNLKGTLVIPDPATSNQENGRPLLAFANEYQCLPYDESLVKNSPILGEMIRNRKVVVIDDVQARRFQAKYDRIMADSAEKTSRRDDANAGILLDKKEDGLIMDMDDDPDSIDLAATANDPTELEGLVKGMKK